MWINSQNQIVRDNTSYVDEHGTQYPANFPRSEIPGLQEVPDDEAYLASIQQEQDALFNQNIDIQLRELDEKSIRAIREITRGLGAVVDAHGKTPVDYLNQYEEMAVFLRDQRK